MCENSLFEQNFIKAGAKTSQVEMFTSISTKTVLEKTPNLNLQPLSLSPPSGTEIVEHGRNQFQL